MKTYNVQRLDLIGPFAPKSLEIDGDDLIDAIKRNFPEILKKSAREYIPFRFPMTAKLVWKQTIPENAKLTKVSPDGTMVPNDDAPRGHIELRLEWMYTSHNKKPESVHKHTVYINASKSELIDDSPFELEGN